METRSRVLLLALGLDPDAPVATALSAARARVEGPGEVTRPEGFDVHGRPTLGGLQCEAVFGPLGAPERGTRCGHVQLPIPVVHPLLAGAAIETLVVLPPDLRPRAAVDDEDEDEDPDPNDHYRRVVNRTARLRRLLALGAPATMVDIESRMLEEAVQGLFLRALVRLAGLEPTSVVPGAPLPRVAAPDAELLEALAALGGSHDAERVERAAALALRHLPAADLLGALNHRLEEAVPAVSGQRAARTALHEALFERLGPEHPAWRGLARGAVDRLSSRGRLAEALECARASDDDPLRIGVVEAELGLGTRRLASSRPETARPPGSAMASGSQRHVQAAARTSQSSGVTAAVIESAS